MSRNCQSIHASDQIGIMTGDLADSHGHALYARGKRLINQNQVFNRVKVITLVSTVAHPVQAALGFGALSASRVR